MAHETKAYLDGYTDGLAWDLDGFESLEEARATAGGGWAESTINAVGFDECKKAWGVRGPGCWRTWVRACAEYERGIRAALNEPLCLHSGLLPKNAECECDECVAEAAALDEEVAP